MSRKIAVHLSGSGFSVQESIPCQVSEASEGFSGLSENNTSISLESSYDISYHSKGAASTRESAWDSGYRSGGSMMAFSEHGLNSSLREIYVAPVHDYEDTENVYQMNHPRRGQCIIINNKKFNKEMQLKERHGSDADAANMYKIFKQMGFDVTLMHDQTASQMLSTVIKVSKDNHKDNDCFAMVLLTHGDEGIVFGTDAHIKIDALVAPIKGNRCPTLVGKPKLFFIQACRGTNLDVGVDVTDAVGDDGMSDDKTHRIPAEADFLYAFSSPEGHYSFRNKVQGSWFIQALSAVFEEYGSKKEIVQLLTRVNRKMALDFQSRAAQKELSGMKQVSSIVSMLTKELYFQPK